MDPMLKAALKESAQLEFELGKDPRFRRWRVCQTVIATYQQTDVAGMGETVSTPNKPAVAATVQKASVPPLNGKRRTPSRSRMRHKHICAVSCDARSRKSSLKLFEQLASISEARMR